MARYSLFLMLLISGQGLASQDPTAPLGWQQPEKQVSKPKKAVTHPVPKLQSIVCEQSQTCSAVLSGKVVTKGSTVQGYKVTEINDEFVFLQRANKQWKLGLFSMDVKY
ncbi:MSHA biogenesis protein MshK [Vibrio hippocampi]|uniref:MSHA biogenesis protein MshK n=1 Tax=Vibrio hippocampi TaxID=654686 RepID=A0ABN8DIN1_9VIBR|nr:MSHA biogenesis protein MshK [Vibrio hippocampi]CAH0526878.1 hypothetical protein VHP8226_02254 [Vibrio hippocampi]